jgi:hypothetical protein
MPEPHPSERRDVARHRLRRRRLLALRPPLADERDHADERVRVDWRRAGVEAGLAELIGEDVADPVGEIVMSAGIWPLRFDSGASRTRTAKPPGRSWTYVRNASTARSSRSRAEPAVIASTIRATMCSTSRSTTTA